MSADADEEYKLGVKNGKEGDFFDDINRSFGFTSAAYNKGYDYGVDHRHDSSPSDSAPMEIQNTFSFLFGGSESGSESNKGKEDSSADASVEAPKESTGSASSYSDSGYSGGDSFSVTTISDSNREKEDRSDKTPNIPRYHVYKHTSHEAIKKALYSGQYSGVYFEPTIYLLRYKCDRCGHEYEEVYDNHGTVPELNKCRMGCSEGDGGLSFLWILKIIISFFTGKPPFGYGKLISEKEL